MGIVLEETHIRPPDKSCSRDQHKSTRQHQHSRIQELALWSSLTLETKSHGWVSAGYPRYTGPHHDVEAAGGSPRTQQEHTQLLITTNSSETV